MSNQRCSVSIYLVLFLGQRSYTPSLLLALLYSGTIITFSVFGDLNIFSTTDVDKEEVLHVYIAIWNVP